MSETIPALRVLEDQPIHTDLKLCDDLFIKMMTFAVGTYIPQHSHGSSHYSLVGAGSVRAWKDGVLMGDFQAPAGILIEAHAKHMFLALEPNTNIFCVHAVKGGDDPHIHELHEVEMV